TIYPEDDVQAKQIAWEIHYATVSFRGPRIVSDRPLTRESLVHYRYGAFKRRSYVDNNIQKIEAIENNSGELEKDYRSGWYFVPKWVKDCPFEYQAGHLSKSKIGTKYKVLKTLTQRAKGGIYLVVDTEAENKNQLFIMKEARKFIGNDSFGRDARHRLRNEKYFLQKLENV